MTGDRFVVLATDGVSETGLRPLLDDARFQVVRVGDSKDPAFAETLPRAHGLVVRSATKVRGDLLERASGLRVVGRAGVGVDNIDLEACTARGIAVCNAPAGNTISAAELTMALMLATVRRVGEAGASLRSGAWARARFQGVELRGRTLGLVGAGRIGGAVAYRARAFGMHVVAYDPYLSDERAEEMGARRASLPEVLAQADVLSLHVPLTDDTRGMIGADAIARMKEGSYLINVARGGLVDEAALAEALTSGHLAGAALDVFEREPLPSESPLRAAPNLVLTPHLGASTAEAQELVATEVAEAVRAALAEGDLSTALNAPAVGAEALRELRPLFELGRRLGRLGCALAPGGPTALEVRYAGSSDQALGALAAHVTMGLLDNVLGSEQVNVVSAGHLARERGIDVARTRLAHEADYTEFVEVAVRTGQGVVRVAGALLGAAHPRIVVVDDYHVDIMPEGTLIVLHNHDVPGVIGRVGALLGGRGINIAGYHQARRARGGDALAAIAVDGEVGPDVRRSLLELEEVSSAAVVRLG